MPYGEEITDTASRGLIIAFILLFIVTITAGVLFYQYQEQQITDQVTGDLIAIAKLKADQITSWREDRLYDARVVSSGVFFTEGADHYLTYGDNESREKILSRFIEMNTSPQYQNILLVGPQGDVRLSLDPAITSLQPSVKSQVAESLATGSAAMTDFHYIPGTDHIHLDVIAPLITRAGGIEKPVGAVLLSIDPDDFLYPYVQSWPVPRESAETLLVEREGDHVLYLNELRHQPNTALNLTIPVSRTDLPAVMAVLGTTGAFTGKDYRGIDVISVLEPIPGSPWFMVTKVDMAEAYSGWRSSSGIIIVLVVVILAGALIIAGLVWQRRQKYYYRTLYTSESERVREEKQNRERLETLLQLSEMESAGEQELADFVLDAACRLTDSPLAFVGIMTQDESVFDITAWSKSVMKDCSVATSPIHFPIEKAGIWAEAVRKRGPLIVNDYSVPLAGKKGLPPGHVPVIRFTSVPVFDEKRIVMVCAVANKETDYTAMDVDNLTLLMQGVWNHNRKRAADEALRQKNTDLEAAYEEITANEEELKANFDELVHSQRSLAESERKYRNLYQYAQVGLFETSFKDATVIACNQRYATLAGFSSIEEAIGKDIVHLYVNADDRTEVGRILREQGSIENHTVQLRNHSTGKIFWGQFSARFNFEREVAEGSIIDITEQKEGEARLRESEERYRAILETMQDAYFRADSEGMITMVNPAAAVMYGYQSAEDMIGIPVVLLYANRNDRDAMFRQLDASGRISDYSGMGRRKDGSLFWVSINVRVTFDALGKIQASEGFVRDITARKQTEAALEERTRFFDTMFESLAVSTWISDEKGTAIRANPSCLKFFGATQEELIGKYNIFRDNVIEKNGLMPEIIKVFATGQPVSITIDYDFGAVDHVHVRDATHKFITSVFTPIVTRDGNVTNVVVQSIDLTEIRRAEERLRESELRFRTMIDWTYDWEYWIGPDREVIYVSPSVEQITGYSPAEFTTDRMLIDRIIHPDDHILWEEHLLHHADADHPANPSRIEFRIMRKDGSLRWIGHECRLIYMEDGTWAGTRISNRDITERKQADTYLAIAQQQYRELFDSVSIGILRSTPGPEGTIIEVNPAAIRIFEADSREQLLAVRPGDLYLDHDERRRISEEIVAKGAITGREVRYKTLKGRVFWGSITSSKKISDDGQVYFDNTIEDITDRKRAEEQLLLKDNAFVSSIAANSIADIRGIITHVNPAFLKLWGYPAEEDAIGHSVSSFFAHEEDGQPVLVALDTLGRWEGEFLAKRTDGSTFFTQGIATIIRNAKGDPIGYQSTNLDITDRKRSEEALKASEEKFSTAFKTSPYAITITRIQDGNFIEVNDAFTPITGFSYEEALSGSSVGLGLWVDTEDRKRVIATLLDGRTVSGEEFAFRKKNGEIITGLFSARIISLNNEPCILSSINDISDRKRAEEALRASEAHLLAVLDATPFPIALVDVSDNNIDFWSRSALTLFGHTAPTAAEWFEIAYPDPGYRREVLERWKPALEKARLSGQVVNAGEYRVTCQDGSVRVCELYAVFLADRLIVTFNDITDRTAAEEETRSASAFLDTIVEMSPFSMWISDNEGTVMRVNHALCQAINLTSEEIVGRYNILRDTNLESQGVMPDVRAVFEKHTPARFSIPWKAADTGNVDFQGARDMHIDVSLFPILNEQGELTHVVCQWVDITERKKAEVALFESEEKYRLIFEYSPLGHLSFDNEGVIVACNDKFIQIIGSLRETLIGLNMLRLRDEKMVSAVQNALNGSPGLYEGNYSSVTAKKITPLRGLFAPLIAGDGRISGGVGIIEDITERKTAEELREKLIRELEQKNAELERFTYTVSHDLKSPLITIRGFAGLIEDDARRGDTLQLKMDINRITSAADIMQELLADVLELSRIGRVISPPEKIPFGTIARQAVDLLAGPLAERKVRIGIAPDLPIVQVDHARIREVMVNLIENAIKFLGNQSDPEIRIGADTSGETPVFFVQDNGMGINPRYLDRIFNLFERLDAAAPGTGIGLTIARRIIEVHGGKIWAESEGPGKGTTFRFTLPGGD